MDTLKRTLDFDPAPYGGPDDAAEARYGLPSEVKFCKRCVISNQRPNSSDEFRHTGTSAKVAIHFDEDGICDACRLAEDKQGAIDWKERERELIDLCDRYRSKDGAYDCIVPGSGGKDSFYAAHMLKYNYGMRPLTITWAPNIYTPWGWGNFQRWIHAGFDNQLFTPNGRVHRLLTRLAVENLFHPFQPFTMGQKNLPPKLSVLYKIPLVFYGEPGAEYGTPKGAGSRAEVPVSFHTLNGTADVYVSGVAVTDLKDRFGITGHDLDLYMPARTEDLEEAGTEVQVLGYYLKWHPQSCYYYAQEHGGFQPAPERTPGTYSKYNSIDDKIDDFHYYTTFIKFGIGRATYDAAQEIRSGDITRDEGVALVRRFDGEFPERFADEIFEYLSIPEDEFPEAAGMFDQPVMDRDYFMGLADTFRSPHLWKLVGNDWKLRHTVWEQED